MQNAFSPASVAVKGSGADKIQNAQNAAESRTSRFTDGGSDAGKFAPLLSSLTQTSNCSESDKSFGEKSEKKYLDLTLSAEQGETREEQTASLYLNDLTDPLLLSRSVLDLLASMRDGLEEQGVDLGTFQQQMENVLEDILGNMEEMSEGKISGEEALKRLTEKAPGLSQIFSELSGENEDITEQGRLAALLSRLRTRYPATVKSDRNQHLNVEVSLSDSLKLGLDASLRFQPDDGDAENAEKSPLTDFRVHELPWTGEKGVPDVALKTTRPDEAEETNEAEEPGSGDDASRLGGMIVYASQQGVNQNTDRKTSAQEGQTGQDARDEKTVLGALREDRLRTGRRGEGSSASSDTSKEAGENTGEKRRNVAGAERSDGFERFFEGVLARRGGADSGREVMELGGSFRENLRESEVLRQGLENVVRFIRVSGEQKALLIVDPPALGRLSVELTGSATGLEASIKVSSEQIRQLIQDQLIQLRMALEQQGVQLTRFSVDVHQDNSRQHEDTERRGKGVTRVSAGEDTPDDAQDEQTVFRADLTQGLLYWIA